MKDLKKRILSLSSIMLLAAIIGLLTFYGPKMAQAAEPVEVTMGVSYIPNVQFAPLYVAQKMGFYAAEGIKVKIEYGYENDFVALAAQGKRDFAVASGDQIIMARSQGLPVIYVMDWYHRYPVGLLAPEKSGIKSLKDLYGKKVGLPGFFGSSYVGWKALVHGAGLDEKKITLKEIGFTQAAALERGIVDAAVVYVMNEPIQLADAGMKFKVFEVSDHINLVSNGLMVGEKLIKENPEMIRKVVRATIKGLAYTINHPEEAFAVVREVLPEIKDEDAPMQRKVLEASIKLWRNDNLGFSSEKSWQDTLDFFLLTGMVKDNENIKLNKLYTNEFVK